MKDYHRDYTILRGTRLLEDRRKTIADTSDLFEPDTPEHHQPFPKSSSTPRSEVFGTETPKNPLPNGSSGAANTFAAGVVAYGHRKVLTPSDTKEGRAVKASTTPKALTGDGVKDWVFRGDGHSEMTITMFGNDGSTGMLQSDPQTSTPESAPNPTTPRSKSPLTPKHF